MIIKILEKILDKIKYINKPITIPFDLIVMRLVEVVQAVPILLWILAGLTIIGAHGLTLGRLIALIGCTNWVIFTRLVRGEMLRIRALEYMEAAALIGASPLRQMLRHALPNIITSALVAFSFGIANGVLLEAFLSFLGLGLPPEQVTWGTMLQDGRADFGNWWLIVFPGFAIFFTVFTFNCLGEKLSDPTAT